jgi:hypothetical protein
MRVRSRRSNGGRPSRPGTSMCEGHSRSGRTIS